MERKRNDLKMGGLAVEEAQKQCSKVQKGSRQRNGRGFAPHLRGGKGVARAVGGKMPRTPEEARGWRELGAARGPALRERRGAERTGLRPAPRRGRWCRELLAARCPAPREKA